jgi:hypothetical protein
VAHARAHQALARFFAIAFRAATHGFAVLYILRELA